MNTALPASLLVHQYLDASTGNLPEAEAKALDPWVTVTPHEWGWWVWVRPENDMNTIPQDLPALTAIMALARNLGCRWINFDAEAEAIEGFPYWEW